MSDFQRLADELGSLSKHLREAEAAQAASIAAVHAAYRESARNLIHYVALRQHDLRPMQLDLWRSGLSSLGRLEGHALDAIERVRDRVGDALARRGQTPPAPSASRPSWDDAERLLHDHTHELLGPKPQGRHVYVMVTAPDAGEVDDAWADAVLSAGMNVLRVNAAHEDEGAWTRIVHTVRAAAERARRPCHVLVDLPGPKLRTRALSEGPRVVRWRPERDELGRVVAPRRIVLHPRSAPPTGSGAVLAVPDGIWPGLARGDRLAFRDARGKKREITIVSIGDGAAIGELSATAYVAPGCEMNLVRDGHRVDSWQVDGIPPRPFRLRLRAGDRLLLLKDDAAPHDPAIPAFGCTLRAAMTALRPGHRVIFDDGHVHAVTESIDENGALLRVVHVPAGEARLAGDKGINLPDCDIELPLLGEDDERALAFATRHADLVGASFVRGPEDVHELYQRLGELGATQLGVLLKIETRGAFGRLPAILLAAMQRHPAGVMIARGDLAIETGFQRLAELQEEILWLCEAAHLPVVLATQVLDSLAHTGQPSRAEVTDAAMAVRAECVMLNKGPFVADAVRALDDILRRMEQHQYKKRSLYRRLHLELPPTSGQT